MTLEQLKSEAREEYGDGDYEWNDLDTLITTAFNAGLERAVEVVVGKKKNKQSDHSRTRVCSQCHVNEELDDITTQLQAEVNKDNK